jgi:hypothetical protein
LVALIVFLYAHRPASFSSAAFDAAIQTEGAHRFLALLALIHATICIVLVFLTPKPVAMDKKVGRTTLTKKASARIRFFVWILYGSLAWLYIIYTVLSFTGFAAAAQAWAEVFEIVTATAIFFLYVELTQVTVKIRLDDEDGRHATETLASDALRQRIIFCSVAMSLILLTVMSYLFTLPATEIVIRIIIACMSGATLALVVGRLSSVYMNPGTAALFFLYLYAVIQPFAAFFQRPTIQFVVTSIALPLKLLLWLVFVWEFTTGNLWEYIDQTRDVLEKREVSKSLDVTGLTKRTVH